jgi:hypothetical protein
MNALIWLPLKVSFIILRLRHGWQRLDEANVMLIVVSFKGVTTVPLTFI